MKSLLSKQHSYHWLKSWLGSIDVATISSKQLSTPFLRNVRENKQKRNLLSSPEIFLWRARWQQSRKLTLFCLWMADLQCRGTRHHFLKMGKIIIAGYLKRFVVKLGLRAGNRNIRRLISYTVNTKFKRWTIPFEKCNS